jgi:hypothetical protein
MSVAERPKFARFGVVRIMPKGPTSGYR